MKNVRLKAFWYEIALNEFMFESLRCYDEFVNNNLCTELYYMNKSVVMWGSEKALKV